MIDSIQIEFNGPPRFMKREMNNIVKHAHRQAGRHWQREMLPRHFTETGGRSYGYRRRGGKYRQRKQKKHGHKIPLVWTGDSRRGATKGAIIATFKRVRVRVPSGNLRWGGPESDPNSMISEVKRYTQGEKEVIQQIMKKSIARSIRAIRRRKVERIQ